uniref:ZFYVE26-like TPR repeats domain-containing protein n=1 Tax=Oryza meridionalis TaxID=40149 RepID=A0A0E0C464_9ORYZ
MAASEREAELLARVAANHLYLGQFEALRAALLSLRRRADPGLAAGFLRAVVAAGGRVPGVLWSAPPACPSPSHLAWLAALELAALPSTPNPEALRLKAEFLVLLQHVADDPAATGAEARGTLSRLLDLGVARLKREVEGGGEAGVGAEEVAVSQEDLTGLWGLFLGKAELFDALCAGVSRQVALDSGLGTDVLLWLRQSVQLAHLDAMKSLVAAGDLEGATGHLRFLCLDHGVEEDEYKIVLGDLVRRGWPKSSNYGGTWFESHDRIIKMLGSALQSSTPQLVQLIQLILDDILSEEIEDHGASDANWMPLPFKKFMETLSLERGAYLDDKTMLNRAITSCKKDLYHYSRISGKHVLEVVMETVLSLIKREQLQEAANAISMFPLLQPLVAVLGWDILKGKTALRRKLLQLFWTSKSQALRLQEYPHYRTETDETSCEEYLCDLLCFHLDVACFVSSVNSGRQWNLRNSLLFTQQEQDSDVNSTEILDPFVENLILERLAVQTPIRVLFDVVPGIKMHDIELMHMRYALQSAALSLGEMEKSAIDGNEHHYQIALSYLREMQSFMEAIKSTPRKATSLLSEIFPGSSPKVGPNYWDQIQEVALISVIKRILQRLRDILDLRPLGLLHQMIDDAFKGKRQFLNGKLHNVARAIVDEDSDGTYSKESIKIEKKDILSSEKGIILGHGLRILKQASRTDQTASTVVENNAEHKGSTSRYLGPVSTKPSTYLSNFIIYIATIGDIVDGTDTTHDFNYFSLVYERPKDLLTRLVFERGSTDAAAKVADTMGVDFVHEIISACVPPVFPPRTGQGWACIPLLPTLSKINSENRSQSAQGWSVHDSSLSSRQEPLYPLQLNLVKHLAQLSSVRAVLACVFGSSILSGDSELYSNVKDAKQAPEIKRSFYEFALEQSERYPTLNRWIQMQCNLHRVSESAVSAETDNEVTLHQPKGKFSSKRAREPDSDAESEIEDIVISGKSASNSLESPKCDEAKLEPTTFISFDWDNEGPYEKAVEREEISLGARQFRAYGSHNFGSDTWQYCLRLRDKKLAAQLALKYLHNWDLDAAANVLTLCICHLPENDPMWSEVLRMKQSLQRYGHIMTADDHYTRWQEVEVDCEDDPEGLALRLAAKGAVSAALEVAESASLSIDLRRELQGRQLVKLLTTDPLNGGGPAAASRFLSTLRDSNDALPVAIGAMKLLPDLRSKQLLRTVGNLSDDDVARLNSWALGLRVLSLLPLPSQQRCSSLHEHPQLILEVLLMMKQLQSASLILKEFPSLRDDKLIVTYAKKAISINVNSTPREPRLTISGSRAKQKKVAAPAKTNFVQSFGNFQREARKAFSWVPRDSGTKTPPKDILRKRKSSGSGGERSSWEATPGVQEERAPEYPSEGQERLPFVSAPEEWVLTGDPDKDNATRACHRYESSPDITLFKALLSLCTSDSIAGKGALEICITQMRDVLSSLQLPLNASMDNIARAYHATETYVQALSYAKNLLKKLVGTSDLSSSSERSRDVDDISVDTGSSSAGSQNMDGLSDLLPLADLWLGRAELLQSLLGSGIIASLDDFADKESSTNLRDRLIDAFPVWVAWGHALVRMEHYSQARVKFKQALQQYKGDATHFVLEIISTIEGGPPVDVSSVRSMYEHLAKSAATIFDDSLSADAYLNVLYMPSTFPRSERSRQSKGPMDSQFESVGSYLEDGPRSNLDGIRYAECIHYLQEYARPEMLAFMFRHGHYAEACSLFFPSNQPTDEGETSLSSIPRNDPLTTDYGTIDDLCDLCLGYGAMTVLENTILTITQSPTYQGSAMTQYMNAILTRICNYCETHRHFNYLYNFLVLKGDHVASGLCCIQLYVNSMSQEEALKHLGHAKSHFEEALSVRDRTTEATKLVPRTARNKSASEKMTRETIMKFSTRVSYQMDVVKALNSVDGPQWKTSLFGNPTDAETLRRRCMVVETLAEKHFDLAFRMLHEFDLPAVDIYAGVAASLAERKKGGQLTEFLKNIRGTIDDDEWDQVLGAAINVYANKHKERPDRLIDMLLSNHRKVLACVVCGRLKSAFQIASRSGSVADVQYVAHQALHANALPVLDMCKQWLAQYM